jgi:hypothetical protein
MNPKYPIYIPTKNRSDSRLTVKALQRMKVPFFVVIEPHEHDLWRPHVDEESILHLPWSRPESSTELVNARNWIKNHSASTGAKRHWQMDDNIMAFCRLNRNSKIRVDSGTMFRCAEDFVDRYTNIALSGFNYRFFAVQRAQLPAFRVNRRIYSCTLVLNEIDYKWRDIYNDDTDICIRVLQDGWCTILFLAFLCDKAATMTVKGGNTDIYKATDHNASRGNGRLLMAESLAKQHPFLASVVKRYGRDHHHVNYDLFKKNKLIKKKNLSIKEGVDNYGMILVDKDSRSIVDVE